MTDSYTLFEQAEEFEDQNQFEKAAEYFLKAAQMFLKVLKVKNAGICFSRGGLCLYNIGKYDEALVHYKRALQLAEQLGVLKIQGGVLVYIGVIMRARGDLDGALDHYKRALDIDEQLGDLKEKGRVLTNIGSIKHDRGDLDGALDHYKRALEIAEQLGDSKNKTAILTNIGSIKHDRGDLDGALDHYKRALDITEQLGDLEGKGLVLTNTGLIMRDRGDLDGALDHFKRALDIAEQLGDLDGKGSRLINIGLILHDRGDLDGALDHYKQTLNLIQKSIKGQELDFKSGRITCPGADCPGEIQIKLTGIQGAITKTCPVCNSQFSIWVDANSVYQIGGLSEGAISGELELRDQVGRETETEVPEWLKLSAITTKNMAICYEEKSDFSNACASYFQAASMYGGLGFLGKSEKNIKYLESIFPKIDETTKEIYAREITLLRNKTPDILRSREFVYIFPMCPGCEKEHQVRASETTIAIEVCANCQTKFSVYYNVDEQEYYTTEIEKPKVKGKKIIPKMKLERDEVKFCARCRLRVDVAVQFCPRCRLKILRD